MNTMSEVEFCSSGGGDGEACKSARMVFKPHNRAAAFRREPTIVFHYIYNFSSRFGTFGASTPTIMREEANVDQWKHV